MLNNSSPLKIPKLLSKQAELERVYIKVCAAGGTVSCPSAQPRVLGNRALRSGRFRHLPHTQVGLVLVVRVVQSAAEVKQLWRVISWGSGIPCEHYCYSFLLLFFTFPVLFSLCMYVIQHFLFLPPPEYCPSPLILLCLCWWHPFVA